MAFDTVIDKAQLENAMRATADAIREKTGSNTPIPWEADVGFAEAIGTLSVEELIQHTNIPTYVKAEALRVANAVQTVRMDDSIVFLSMSDNHHYGVQKNSDQYPDSNGIQTNESNLHAAMAVKVLAYGLNLDFLAQLGDVTWGNAGTTSALLQSQANELLSFLRESHKDIPCFHAIGNHDTGIYFHNQMIESGNSGVYTESGQWLYNNFTALSASSNTIFGGEANGGYCYRDFPEKKLRVFLLNTSEALVRDQSDKGTLGSQREWFANALLNLNSKSDAATWSFLVLSHYPADYGNAMPLSELLRAYVEGKSITISVEDGTTASVSFASKNSAKMIAQFHGHIHNFLASKLYTYVSGAGVKYDAWRICTPNAQYNRENYYNTLPAYPDISFKEDTTYSKIVNSAKDTSFVVYVINPSEQKIHAFCYGAGYDRVIGYAATVYHSVTTSLTNVTMSGGASSVEDGERFSAVLSIPPDYEWRTVTIVMGGVDITSDVYSNGDISIPAVTGNISITASARKQTSYTNQIEISTDTNGNIYNGVGYKNGVYVNSSGVEAARSGSLSTGFIPCKGNAKSTIYLANIGFMQNASDASYQRITIYDANKTFLAQFNANATGSAYQPVVEADGRWSSFKIRASTGGKDTSGDLYIRISANYIGEDSVITVDEEITD